MHICTTVPMYKKVRNFQKNPCNSMSFCAKLPVIWNLQWFLRIFMQIMVEHHSSLKLRTFLYNGTFVKAISCRPNVQYLSILTSEFDFWETNVHNSQFPRGVIDCDCAPFDPSPQTFLVKGNDLVILWRIVKFTKGRKQSYI